MGLKHLKAYVLEHRIYFALNCLNTCLAELLYSELQTLVFGKFIGLCAKLLLQFLNALLVALLNLSHCEFGLEFRNSVVE